jgi:hypothetical protein
MYYQIIIKNLNEQSNYHYNSQVVFLVDHEIEDYKNINFDYILELFRPIISQTKDRFIINCYLKCVDLGNSIHYFINFSTFTNDYKFKLFSTYFKGPNIPKHLYYVLENQGQQCSTILNKELLDNGLSGYSKQTVLNNCDVLGFYKAEPNPKYLDCKNCIYYVGTFFLDCTVRPGYKQLCQDHKKL